MGIFDKFKKKDSNKKADKPKRKVTEEKEVRTKSVVTPDGKLVNVQTKDKTKSKKVKLKKEDTADAYKILLKSLITEKGSSQGLLHKYYFEVAPDANKVEIKKAIRKVYNVDPVRVNIMNISGKKVRYGRTEGRTKHWKKAIITLPPDQKIDIQEGL